MKKYDYYYWSSMVGGGTIMTIVSFFHADTFFNIFFNICLGLFIGGLFFAVISFFLAQMESNIGGEEIDLDAEIDVDMDVDIDIDTDLDIDVDMDVDVDADVDIDIDTDLDIDVDADVDIDIDTDIDIDVDTDIDTDIDSELGVISPAPVMLLLSAAFLIYGISGIILFYAIVDSLKFIIFFATPAIVYLSWKVINNSWKKITKSRYYSISSTMNLIGKKGEVTLGVDNRGGIIRIPSSTPMRFERIHVKPLKPNSRFALGEKVYICDVRNGFLLIDNNKKLIKKTRYWKNGG
ncbi:MAG: hypothetical protein EU529_13665 [Promethearchaeota archaeon]|nr:MAG: hypothetical protein EU529_13665 [Candidatus Lokiarchaeota archaeon]